MSQQANDPRAYIDSIRHMQDEDSMKPHVYGPPMSFKATVGVCLGVVIILTGIGVYTVLTWVAAI